jgi:hypothetical protein
VFKHIRKNKCICHIFSMKLSTHGFSTTELTSYHGNKPTRLCLQKLEDMGLIYEMYTRYMGKHYLISRVNGNDLQPDTPHGKF